eukprot:230548-Rhodomonas_salina.1
MDQPEALSWLPPAPSSPPPPLLHVQRIAFVPDCGPEGYRDPLLASCVFPMRCPVLPTHSPCGVRYFLRIPYAVSGTSYAMSGTDRSRSVPKPPWCPLH